jgi:putative transposase
MGYWETFYHLVWATKERVPIIDTAGEVIIDRSLRHTCREAGVVVQAIGVMPDHIHLALSIPPRWAVSNLVRDLKVSATHAVNTARELPYVDAFAWQHEFGVFTFGRASLENVIAYVEHQREHHAANTLRTRFEQISRLDAPS